MQADWAATTTAARPASSSGYPGDDAVFTLSDGEYHLGLGALVNSLYAAGYRGVVYAAYRDSLPPWAAAARAAVGDHMLEIAPGCAIRFIKIDYRGHLASFKPLFMLETLGRCCADAVRLFYFDVDIVVKCPWAFMRHWAECGIAVCQDVNEPSMSANHPLRRYWSEFAGKIGLSCRPVEGYYNSGFLGLMSRDSGFLDVWHRIRVEMERVGVPLQSFHSGGRASPFMAMDQDALNIALMTTTFPISPMDTGAMDITPGYVMSHALARAKPWRRRYMWDALMGYPPGAANKNYWRHVRRPIAVMPRWRQLYAHLSLAVASAVGRFYRRG